MRRQMEADFLNVLFVLAMNFIPTLPQRERTHVTTPRRDTRSSPYLRNQMTPIAVAQLHVTFAQISLDGGYLV